MATSCTAYALKGMGQECLGSVAGLQRLLIGLKSEWVVSANTSQQIITALSGTTSSATFYEYYIMDESSSLSSTLTVNNQNGVKYYNNVINATFVRMRPEKHIELMALANEKLVVFAVDNNNQGWFLGEDSFVTATEETAQSGQAFDDLSGYQVTLTHRSGKLPFGIEASVYGKVTTPDVYE